LLVPEDVVVDTSFVVEALVGTQQQHEVCRGFLERLLAAETTLYFNRLLEIELAEAAFRFALQERLGRRVREADRRDGRLRRRAGRLMEETQDAWDEALAGFSFVCVELHEVADMTPQLMRDHGLRSYDAVHVATALLAGVRDVVTLDVGFANVPPEMLNVHTTRHRLASCRARRGGAA
jgi:predicted nucleic acid-binding protein